jgi:predicted MPP superfamily phosphohydrolase
VKRPRLTRRKFIAALITTPFALGANAFAIEPTWLRIERIRLNEKPTCRLVHFTDLHHKGDLAYLEKVVQTINQQRPDFVCFTGDLIEEAHHAPEALEVLRRIESPLFGIPGNHDHWADLDFDLARQAFARTGGRWLMNEEIVTPDGAAHLFGLSGREHCDFLLDASRKNILLSHYPAGVESYPNTRFDLVLAGHSHGGQVRLPLYGALITPSGVGEFQLGLYHTAAGPLYVNAGIGWFFANIRLFCRPEITVIEV